MKVQNTCSCSCVSQTKLSLAPSKLLCHFRSKRCTSETLRRQLKRLRQVRRHQTKIRSSCLRHIWQEGRVRVKCRNPKPDLPHSSNLLYPPTTSTHSQTCSQLHASTVFSVVPTATVCVSHPDHLPAPKAHLPNSFCKTGNQRNAAEQVPLCSRVAPRRATPRKDTAIW